VFPSGQMDEETHDVMTNEWCLSHTSHSHSCPCSLVGTISRTSVAVPKCTVGLILKIWTYIYIGEFCVCCCLYCMQNLADTVNVSLILPLQPTVWQLAPFSVTFQSMMVTVCTTCCNNAFCLYIFEMALMITSNFFPSLNSSD
jgi:hypothetical protein